VFRFRRNNRVDADFYDPGADVRRIVPIVYRAVLTTMNSVLEADDTADAVAMVKDLGVLMKIRLIEEPVTIDRVLHTFCEELDKISPKVRDTFTRLFFTYSMASYAVLLRREAQNDQKVAEEIFDTTEGEGLLHMLSDELAAQVIKELRSKLPAVYRRVTVPAAKDPVCVYEQNGNSLNVIEQDIKKLADSLLPSNKPMTWDEKAEALDYLAGADTGLDEKREKAIREAYPAYVRKDDEAWRKGVLESIGVTTKTMS